MVPVDMNELVTNVLSEFVELSRSRHAVITWETLPVINGSRQQLFLLFRSLIDNSFKFAKQGESPVIRITYRLVDGTLPEDDHINGRHYHKIVMEDKGIGFNNEFSEKIFMIFQRLHTQQSGYRGKGVGLALAQRIMTNHNGIIMARGMVNDGATFIMYFPVS
jgi:light-regulated signal transduction histidine kinase (bacteriophytochrome)